MCGWDISYGAAAVYLNLEAIKYGSLGELLSFRSSLVGEQIYLKNCTNLLHSGLLLCIFCSELRNIGRESASTSRSV